MVRSWKISKRKNKATIFLKNFRLKNILKRFQNKELPILENNILMDFLHCSKNMNDLSKILSQITKQNIITIMSCLILFSSSMSLILKNYETISSVDCTRRRSIEKIEKNSDSFTHPDTLSILYSIL